MNVRRLRFAGLVAVLGLSASCTPVRQAAVKEPIVNYSTPPGITLQPLGHFAQGYSAGNDSSGYLQRNRVAYADASGMTLYTSDADPPGQSVCVEECLKTWTPALAPAGAIAYGSWSIVVRTDRTAQWALNGKPLYTYVKDVDIGSVGGVSPRRFDERARRREGRTRPVEDAQLPGWRTALQFPVALDQLPPRFAIKEVDDAMGLVLIGPSDAALYVFDGNPDEDRHVCGNPCDWKPLEAPAAASANGDFSIVVRNDGLRQWSFRGKALYTFSRDLLPIDVNGDGVSSHWRIAYVARYFRPPNVTIQQNEKHGKVLADARGHTLYNRDSYLLQTGGGHNFRRGQPIKSVVGRDLGTNPRCGAECLKDWHPLLAPANALPQGSWDIYPRADGTKQWAYRGFAMWTYAGDRQAGDILGHDTFQYFLSDDNKTVIDIGTPYGGQGGAPALYWRLAVP